MSFWYLATPFTKHPRGHEAATTEARDIVHAFCAAGIPAVSPIAMQGDVVGSKAHDLTHDDWLALDFKLIDASHGVIVCLMDGWETSRGVAKEIEYAQKTGKVIYKLPMKLLLSESSVRHFAAAAEWAAAEKKQAPPSNSADRKATPVFSGVLAYFPDALRAVARLSKKGNDKHNPGQPLHWSRDKSSDHADCIVRHQMEVGTIDAEDGELHDVKVAWRALAQLQLAEEKRLKAV